MIKMSPSLRERSSGVLLHPTSLPGPHGSGDIGVEARRFIDFLASAGQRWWQMLPVSPPGYGGSPYSAESSLAGSPALISLESLAEEGLLQRASIENGSPVDVKEAWRLRERHLRAAFAELSRRPPGSEERAALDRFCDENAGWLDDYALYSALKRARGGASWAEWEPALRDREPEATARAAASHAEEITLIKFEQHIFEKQWRDLRAYAARRGIGLIGDIPIFVAHDSADVWRERSIFRLDEHGQPTVVAGVPPDYFSKTGQRWGNPLYRWRRLKKRGYPFWVNRVRSALSRFDALRIDHFIGFVRYWEIPASCPTAIEGRWMKGPGADLFETLTAALGDGARRPLPLIAEDLGAVTPRVKALRDELDLPGLRVLQFAFGDDPSAPDFLPHNYPRRAVVYTGTHDNDTSAGWFHDPGGEGSSRSPEQAAIERAAAARYLNSDGVEVHWDMIRMALLSVADVAIVPAQDLLGLGSEARMNRPGEPFGNWAWRLPEGALDGRVAARLELLTRTFGRGGRRCPNEERAE